MGLSGTTAAFWWGTAALLGLAAIAFFATWGNWQMYRDGEISLFELADMENVANSVFGFSYLLVAVSGILLIIWCSLAYSSAASKGAAHRRWGSGWAVGAWFIPLANFVIPKLVVNEIDRMSNPVADAPPILDRWKHLPRLIWSDLWWIALLTGIGVNVVASVSYASAPTIDDGGIGIAYAFWTVGATLLSAAAALAGVTVLVLGRRLKR